MPLSYNYYNPNIDTYKRTVNYSLFARSTIPWSLECEANNTSRADVIDLFNNGNRDKNKNLSWLNIIAIILLVTSCLLIFYGFMEIQNFLPNGHGSVIVLGLGIGIQVACGLTLYFFNLFAQVDREE